MVGIYRVLSPSGAMYLGQSTNIKDRERRYRNLNCKSQTSLYRSLMKYGFCRHMFEIIHELPKDVSIDVLNSYEEFYISSYKEAGVKMLNIKLGGGGGGKMPQYVKDKISAKNKGRVYGEDIRKRMSEIRKGKPSPLKGCKGSKRNLTQEQRLILSERAKKRIFKHSDESKKKMSISRIGVPSKRRGISLSDEHKQKLKISHKGKKLSTYTRRKISEANKGRFVSPETRTKLSISNKGQNNRLGYKNTPETINKMKKSQADKWKRLKANGYRHRFKNGRAVKIILDGKEEMLSDVCEKYGLPRNLTYQRIKRDGVSISELIKYNEKSIIRGKSGINSAIAVEIYKSSLTISELCEKYNVSKRVIQRIKKGERWADFTLKTKI